jgi:hypothetical protein
MDTAEIVRLATELGWKVCSGECKNLLPPSEYYAWRLHGRIRLRSSCKKCTLAARREYIVTEEDRESNRVRQREYYHLNLDRSRKIKRDNLRRNYLAALVRGARLRAKKRNLPYNLTDYLPSLQARYDTGLCELTGLPHHIGVDGPGPYSPSLDRVDSHPDVGYLYSNIRIVLWSLNSAFGSSGLEAFLPIAKALVEKQCTQRSSGMAGSITSHSEYVI